MFIENREQMTASSFRSEMSKGQREIYITLLKELEHL